MKVTPFLPLPVNTVFCCYAYGVATTLIILLIGLPSTFCFSSFSSLSSSTYNKGELSVSSTSTSKSGNGVCTLFFESKKSGMGSENPLHYVEKDTFTETSCSLSKGSHNNPTSTSSIELNRRGLKWLNLGGVLSLSFGLMMLPLHFAPAQHSLKMSPTIALALDNNAYEASTIQALDLLLNVRDTTMQLEEDLNNGNYPANLQTTVQQIIKNYNLKKNLDVVKSKGISKKENKVLAAQHSNLALEYLYTIVEYDPKLDTYTGKVAQSTVMKPAEIKMAVQALQTSRDEFDQFFSYLDQPLLNTVKEKRIGI